MDLACNKENEACRIQQHAYGCAVRFLVLGSASHAG